MGFKIIVDNIAPVKDAAGKTTNQAVYLKCVDDVTNETYAQACLHFNADEAEFSKIIIEKFKSLLTKEMYRRTVKEQVQSMLDKIDINAEVNK